MIRLYFYGAVFAAIINVVFCDVYTIRNIFPPGGARGGEPFDFQPRVAVFAANVLAGQFSGSAYVEIGSSPVESEPLFVGGCNASEICGTRVTRENRAIVPFVKGIAYFDVMLISKVLLSHSTEINHKKRRNLHSKIHWCG